MLKLITFDYWNTIFDSSNGIERNKVRKQALIDQLDEYSIPPQKIDEMIVEIGEFFNKMWVQQQKTPNSLDMIKHIWSINKLPENPDKQRYLQKIFEEVVLLYPPKLNPNAREVIAKLEEKYILGIVSDAGFSPGTILRSLLNTESILHYFSYFSFSDELNIAKPNIQMFNNILDKAKVKPQEALHIGDIERTDIVGAKANGMRAIKYSGDDASQIYNNKSSETAADFVSNDWNEIYDWIINNED